MNKKCSVIIPAAGLGARMGESIPKQYIRICGKPILCYAIEAFERNGNVADIIPVVGKADVALVREMVSLYGYRKVKEIGIGGALRQDSVYSGLKLVSDDTEIILVHDGARPFICQEDIDKVFRETIECSACVLAVKAKDTVKVADENGFVLRTPDRQSLWNIQTPQGFKSDIIKTSYERAMTDGYVGTDDSSLAERLGYKVKFVEGRYTNKKITTADDLFGAEKLLEEVL